MEFKVGENERHVKEILAQVSQLQMRSDNAKRYSRCWNLLLHGMKETPAENLRVEVLKILGLLAPEDKENMGFLVDTVHGVGVHRENATRPVIVQFTM